MSSEKRTLASGILDADTDTWFLRQPNNFLLLDAPFAVDTSLRHKAVSAVGHMGIPPSAPGITKLLVDRMTSHENIAVAAYFLSQSGAGGSQFEQWLRAERDLLGMN